MKVVSILPYPAAECNAPGANCPNAARVLVTVSKNANRYIGYKSYRLCENHLNVIKEQQG